MSFDLMVFAPEAAPSKRAAFLDWYDQQTDWDDEFAGDDPAVAAPALQAFFAEMVQTFPAAAADAPEDEAGTDYVIGQSLIYMGFAWDTVDQAHAAVSRLAAKHGLGFFDVSSDLAEVWLPDSKGGMRVAHSD